MIINIHHSMGNAWVCLRAYEGTRMMGPSKKALEGLSDFAQITDQIIKKDYQHIRQEVICLAFNI